MPWSVASYNTNPSLNVTVNGIDIAELCAASGYNDALRQIMADIAVWTAAYSVSYPISVANGGTGSANAAAALTALGGLSVTYKQVSQSLQTVAFDFTAAQSAGHVYYTGAAAAATIQPNATIAIVQDTAILIINNGSGALTITRGAGVTLKWAANNTNGDRVLAAGGMATIIKVAADYWFITGTALT